MRPEEYRYMLSNKYERAVFLQGDEVLPRERARYEWAAKNLTGSSVLEIGCSTGYGRQFLPEALDYTGVDLDRKIIEVAKVNFEAPGTKFRCCDVNRLFELFPNYYADTIIAFEVIEHLENGLELVEILKEHCNTLLVSCPYDETPGFWGEHHKLHHLTVAQFKDVKTEYVSFDGQIISVPEEGCGKNLMLLKWQKGVVLTAEPSVLCSISTRGRYETTLPLALQAVLMQTRLPEKLIIYDDNEAETRVDLRELPHYAYLLQMLQMKGVQWEVYYPDEPRGQHFNHQRANLSGYDFVWRIDDDCMPNPDVLEKLLAQMADGVGAVGGSILTPPSVPTINATGKLENLFSEPNIQWGKIKETQEVEHLHCSFLYRAGVADYNLLLSRAAHREETDFTWKLRCSGYKVLVTPCVTWHLKNPFGGIRERAKDLFAHDEAVFSETSRLLSLDLGKIIVLDNGLGDHIVAAALLPELKEKYSKVTVACCYPEVFAGEEVININQAKMLIDVEQWNVYRKMAEWGWTDSLADAYRRLYL